MNTDSFPGVKRPERGADHPHPSSAEVANSFELYLRLPSVFVQACHGVTFTFTLGTGSASHVSSDLLFTSGVCLLESNDLRQHYL
jgi:hypothetical protein